VRFYLRRLAAPYGSHGKFGGQKINRQGTWRHDKKWICSTSTLIFSESGTDVGWGGQRQNRTSSTEDETAMVGLMANKRTRFCRSMVEEGSGTDWQRPKGSDVCRRPAQKVVYFRGNGAEGRNEQTPAIWRKPIVQKISADDRGRTKGRRAGRASYSGAMAAACGRLHVLCQKMDRSLQFSAQLPWPRGVYSKNREGRRLPVGQVAGAHGHFTVTGAAPTSQREREPARRRRGQAVPRQTSCSAPPAQSSKRTCPARPVSPARTSVAVETPPDPGSADYDQKGSRISLHRRHGDA